MVEPFSLWIYCPSRRILNKIILVYSACSLPNEIVNVIISAGYPPGSGPGDVCVPQLTQNQALGHSDELRTLNSLSDFRVSNITNYDPESTTICVLRSRRYSPPQMCRRHLCAAADSESVIRLEVGVSDELRTLFFVRLPSPQHNDPEIRTTICIRDDWWKFHTHR